MLFLLSLFTLVCVPLWRRTDLIGAYARIFPTYSLLAFVLTNIYAEPSPLPVSFLVIGTVFILLNEFRIIKYMSKAEQS